MKLCLGILEHGVGTREKHGVGGRQAGTGGVSRHEGKESCETDPDTQHAGRQAGGRER